MFCQTFRRQINPPNFGLVFSEYDKCYVNLFFPKEFESVFSVKLTVQLGFSRWTLPGCFSLTILAAETLLDTMVMIQVPPYLTLEVFTLPLVHKSLVSKKVILVRYPGQRGRRWSSSQSRSSVYFPVLTRTLGPIQSMEHLCCYS